VKRGKASCKRRDAERLPDGGCVLLKGKVKYRKVNLKPAQEMKIGKVEAKPLKNEAPQEQKPKTKK
jgi:hypothetical protein